MSAPRGTTPTFTLTFSEATLDLTGMSHVYVTFQKGITLLTKSDDDLTIAAKSIEVALSQEETLAFRGDPFTEDAPIEIQANWTDLNGKRAASEVVKYVLSKQLLNEVVS